MRRPILLLVLVLLPCDFAVADKPAPPMTFKKASADGKFLFVMISPEPLESEVRSWKDELIAEIRAIRNTYAKSGLYKNDGSKEPLWTVDDWYRHDNGIWVASDGIHLVRSGGWPPLTNDVRRGGQPNLEWEGITFFARGKPIREYKIGELVNQPGRLVKTVSHFWWLESAELDDKQSRLMLTTTVGDHIVFDLKTGNILQREGPTPIPLPAEVSFRPTEHGFCWQQDSSCFFLLPSFFTG